LTFDFDGFQKLKHSKATKKIHSNDQQTRRHNASVQTGQEALKFSHKAGRSLSIYYEHNVC